VLSVRLWTPSKTGDLNQVSLYDRSIAGLFAAIEKRLGSDLTADWKLYYWLNQSNGTTTSIKISRGDEDALKQLLQHVQEAQAQSCVLELHAYSDPPTMHASPTKFLPQPTALRKAPRVSPTSANSSSRNCRDN
jgi:hypothetical protein